MKKQIIYPLMAALTFCAALTFNGCGASTGFVEQPNDGNQTVIENPFDGEIVKDGESYSFGRAIAFLGADVAPIDEEVYTPVTATLTATVEPIDANQNVIWTTSFVNPSSTWANGKTVSDYITLATETAGSTTCTVTCKAPFGEQIIITCTSQENTAISADCTVDFVQTISNVALTFGNDLPINLGGVTPIEWEMNPTGIGKGGAANVTYDMGDTYTIGFEKINWSIDLTTPLKYTSLGSKDDLTWGIPTEEEKAEHKGSYIGEGTLGDPSIRDGYLTCVHTAEDGTITNYDIGLYRKDNVSSLIFDRSFAEEVCLSLGQSIAVDGDYGWIKMCIPCNSSFFEYDTSSGTLIMDYSNFVFAEIDEEDRYLYTLSLNMEGVRADGVTVDLSQSSYGHASNFMSLLEFAAFTNNPTVQSVSFENTSLKF